MNVLDAGRAHRYPSRDLSPKEGSIARRTIVLFAALLVPLLLGAPAARPAAVYTDESDRLGRRRRRLLAPGGDHPGQRRAGSSYLTSLGHNLVGSGSCLFTATGDLVGLDPMLTSLADHGGPGPTHAPTDQRGAARPADGDRDAAARCDIGAVEALGKSLALKAKPRRVKEGARTRLIARIIPCLGHKGDEVTFFRKKKKIGKRISDAACVARMRAKVKDAVRFRAKVAADDDDGELRDAARVRLRR